MFYAYTVTLHHPSLSPCQCQEVEAQYRQVLEQALGGSDAVLKTWRAWQEAENKLGSLSEDTWKVARQWLIVAEQARQVALQESNNSSEAYFEVQRV
ncbi:MAG TPA: hypothetical protein VNS29_14235 [Burkholderiaceae bacterium]|nr:hypothetical protein [Burkholderiaceae bacterium]